jgi:hypothetical protein
MYLMAMMITTMIPTATLMALFLSAPAWSHPQCLDFRPPFQTEVPLSKCSAYSDFGCCTSRDDEAIQATFTRLQETLSSRDWERCHGYVHEILCLSCSPYAAHVFDAERTMQARYVFSVLLKL